MSSLYKPGRPVEYSPFENDPAKKPPHKKGEYRIVCKESHGKRSVEYIGVSNDLKRRMNEHIKSGKLNSSEQLFAYKVADGRASQTRLNDHERKKIKEHTPPLNKRAGGAGRPYSRRRTGTGNAKPNE